MHKECKRMIRMISMEGEEFKIDIGTKSTGNNLYQSSFFKQERNNTLKSRKHEVNTDQKGKTKW
jgi:hypothetical protein